MDDMNAFERQLATVLDRMGGPEPRVDAMEIVRSTTATEPRRRLQAMVSATRFVIAGSIVALVGGLLLNGIPTQPPSEAVPSAASPAPARTGELLSRLVTEQIEPGVVRIIDDGAGHDLVADPPVGLTIGPDGEVVLFAARSHTGEIRIEGVYMLGEAGTERLPGDRNADAYGMDAAIDRDGALWALMDKDFEEPGTQRQPGGLGRFQGRTWTMPTWPSGSDTFHAVEATSDGSVWVTQRGAPMVARIKDGVWTVLPVPDDGSLAGVYDGGAANFAAAADGTAWLASGDASGKPLPPGTTGLLHFDGERWEAVDLPVDSAMGLVGPLALGPDGTLWASVAATASTRSDIGLLRFRNGVWSVFTAADGVPDLVHTYAPAASLAVDAGGTLWIAFNEVGGSAPPSDPPRGVLSFDGSTWRQYLKGQSVNRVAVAPDGSIWATSLYDCSASPTCEPDRAGGGGLYVIDPEAAATAE